VSGLDEVSRQQRHKMCYYNVASLNIIAQPRTVSVVPDTECGWCTTTIFSLDKSKIVDETPRWILFIHESRPQCASNETLGTNDNDVAIQKVQVRSVCRYAA